MSYDRGGDRGECVQMWSSEPGTRGNRKSVPIHKSLRLTREEKKLYQRVWGKDRTSGSEQEHNHPAIAVLSMKREIKTRPRARIRGSERLEEEGVSEVESGPEWIEACILRGRHQTALFIPAPASGCHGGRGILHDARSTLELRLFSFPRSVFILLLSI